MTADRRSVLIGIVYLAIAVVYCLVFFVGCAHIGIVPSDEIEGYIFESHVDPGVIYKDWILETKVRTGLNQGEAVYSNPSPTTGMPKAAILRFSNRWLMSYEYVLDGAVYLYEYNFKDKHFSLTSRRVLGEGI